MAVVVAVVPDDAGRQADPPGDRQQSS